MIQAGRVNFCQQAFSDGLFGYFIFSVLPRLGCLAVFVCAHKAAASSARLSALFLACFGLLQGLRAFRAPKARAFRALLPWS
jgi:hypothetical protein